MDGRLLKSALVFGANGSGKSDLMRAVAYMRHLVMASVVATDCMKDNETLRFSERAAGGRMDRSSHSAALSRYIKREYSKTDEAMYSTLKGRTGKAIDNTKADHETHLAKLGFLLRPAPGSRLSENRGLSGLRQSRRRTKGMRPRRPSSALEAGQS